MIDLLLAGPKRAPLLLLAPGAGAPMTSPFMDACARLLADCGVATARFEFAYMAARRMGGKRPPPPRAERLIPEYGAAVEAALARTEGAPLFVGGKSLGGRVASLVADDLYRRDRVRGLVCLGYPFHPPAKPEALRTAHLIGLSCPALICQGECDPFGTREEIAAHALSAAIRVHWIAGGDHNLASRRATGQSSLSEAATAISEFIWTHAAGGGSCKAP